MIKIIIAAIALLFAVGVQADTTAKIDKILMYEGGNLVYIYPVGGVQNINGVRVIDSCEKKVSKLISFLKR
jgi:hypothetical protein